MIELRAGPEPGRGRAHRVLVANRGEIAVRVIRAAAHGLETVAVSTSTRRRCVRAGGPGRAHRPRAGQPELPDVDAPSGRRRERRDAVHPGYGFLSEDPVRPRPCRRRAHLRRTARRPSRRWATRPPPARREAAGVPASGQARSLTPRRRARRPRTSGSPPHQGGGRRRGRGIRSSRAPTSCAPSSAGRSEAASAFGDGALYLERLIRAPATSRSRCWATSTGSRPPLRAGLLGPAATPEAHRGGARRRRSRTDAARR